MRLLSTVSPAAGTGKFEIPQRWGAAIPPYAILSHLWSSEPEDEVLLSDIRNGTWSTKPGYPKLKNALEKARQDGYDWLWMDTCCIDTSSSAELTEAINSMFNYYRDAQRCYAYLSDVKSHGPDMLNIESSRWWRRGWTLQELLAPKEVEFFSASWGLIGTKHALHATITRVTGIELKYLGGTSSVQSASVARRMSWAASRSTTKEEDIAYSLLGLFNVNMPMLYGEGAARAFLRLQEEIMKVNEDQSLFAWRKSRDDPASKTEYHGLLADSPRDFKHSGSVKQYSLPKYSFNNMTARGLRITLPLKDEWDGTVRAILSCTDGLNREDRAVWLAVHLRPLHGKGTNEYARVDCGELTSVHQLNTPREIFVRQFFSGEGTEVLYPYSVLQLQGLSFKNLPRPGFPGVYRIASYRENKYKAWRPAAPTAVVVKVPLRSDVRPAFEMDQKSRDPTVQLLIERLWDGKRFVLGLGPDPETSVKAVAFERRKLMSAWELADRFRSERPRSRWELQNHIVEVAFVKGAQAGPLVHFVYISVTAIFGKPVFADKVMQLLLPQQSDLLRMAADGHPQFLL